MVFTTALAPLIWGSTYIVTTIALPDGHPLGLATLRALPAGMILLIFRPRLMERRYWLRLMVLGGCNIGIFWPLLFIAAQRLPGGVAATMGAIQPLVVIALAAYLLALPVRLYAVVSASLGLLGVAAIVLGPEAELDPWGIGAALGGTASMSLGVVLTKRWRLPVDPLALAAWQLLIGGGMLGLSAWVFEGGFPAFDGYGIVGITYLSLIGGALPFVLWTRGVVTLTPSVVTMLGLLSPVAALVLGLFFANEQPTIIQWGGVGVVFIAIALAQQSSRPAKSAIQTHHTTHRTPRPQGSAPC